MRQRRRECGTSCSPSATSFAPNRTSGSRIPVSTYSGGRSDSHAGRCACSRGRTAHGSRCSLLKLAQWPPDLLNGCTDDALDCRVAVRLLKAATEDNFPALHDIDAIGIVRYMLQL